VFSRRCHNAAKHIPVTLNLLPDTRPSTGSAAQLMARPRVTTPGRPELAVLRRAVKVNLTVN